MSNYVPNCKCGRELDNVFQTTCSACQEAADRHEEFVDTMTANTEAIEEAAENRERDLERAAESAERAAYLTNNPGDYGCPACMMISLRYGASCCPKCQRALPGDYWQRIREQERLAAERARVAEEQRQKWLASPEYAMEQEQKKLAVEAAARAKAVTIGGGIFAGLVVLVMAGSLITSRVKQNEQAAYDKWKNVYRLDIDYGAFKEMNTNNDFRVSEEEFFNKYPCAKKKLAGTGNTFHLGAHTETSFNGYHRLSCKDISKIINSGPGSIWKINGRHDNIKPGVGFIGYE